MELQSQIGAMWCGGRDSVVCGWDGAMVFRWRVDLARRRRGGAVGLEVAVAEWPGGVMIGDGRASRTRSLKPLATYSFSSPSTFFIKPSSLYKNVRKINKIKATCNSNFHFYNNNLAFVS